MKRAIIIVCIVIAAAVAVFILRLRAIERSALEREELVNQMTGAQVTPVIVAPVTTGRIEKVLKYTGTVQSEDEVDVHTKISGRIVSIKVEEGDKVDKDQVLAVINPEVTGERFEPFEVTSPIQGRVSKVYLDEGAYVNQMQPIAHVINDRRVRVLMDVLEKDYRIVRKGTPVRLVFDAYPGEVWMGKVDILSPVVDSRTGSAGAEVHLDNSKGLLRAGMFARADVIVEVHENAVLMPFSATLTEILPGRGTRVETKVFVVENGVAHQRSVVLGLASVSHYEALEGLSPGEEVVVLGQSLLHDGSEVRVTANEGQQAD
jgi:multidrug efflux pump subunit AcrA (membrane-fusion protein)